MAPIKNETVNGVEVPVTTPAWAIKGAAVALAVAGPALDAWNPWHLSSDAVKAAILCVFVAVAAVAFFGQTFVAAIHKQGWSLKTLENAAAADKDAAKALLDEIEPLAVQAKPALDAVASHEPRLAAAEAQIAQLAEKVKQYVAQPAESALLSKLRAALDAESAPQPAGPVQSPEPAPAAPAPAEPAEVSTGGTP